MQSPARFFENHFPVIFGSHLLLLCKIIFPPFFGGHLKDFYVKCKNVKISQKRSHLALFRQSIFLPFFVGRLIFCKNGKYVKEYVRKLWTAKLFLFTNLNIPVSNWNIRVSNWNIRVKNWNIPVTN